MSPSRLLHLRVPAGLVEEVDRVIAERGSWSDRTEFVRDALRQLVDRVRDDDLRRRAAAVPDLQEEGFVRRVSSDHWRSCLERAGGDEGEAARLLLAELERLRRRRSRANK
jgi:Arc/MetJ-type ribon-helix-helix transcriptional regulator